jgi:hypothetical protein
LFLRRQPRYSIMVSRYLSRVQNGPVVRVRSLLFKEVHVPAPRPVSCFVVLMSFFFLLSPYS